MHPRCARFRWTAATPRPSPQRSISRQQIQIAAERAHETQQGLIRGGNFCHNTAKVDARARAA
eukprot:9500191-Pyramimonas_sp.AAC.1